MRLIAFAEIIRRVKVIPMFLKDPKESKVKKALIVFGLVYLLLPFDLIPPIIPVFGWLDDLILWIFILDHLKTELDRYDVSAPNSVSKYRGRNVVDVTYTVNDREEEN